MHHSPSTMHLRCLALHLRYSFRSFSSLFLSRYWGLVHYVFPPCPFMGEPVLYDAEYALDSRASVQTTGCPRDLLRTPSGAHVHCVWSVPDEKERQKTRQHGLSRRIEMNDCVRQSNCVPIGIFAGFPPLLSCTKEAPIVCKFSIQLQTRC
jgi:hypothetical protein